MQCTSTSLPYNSTGYFSGIVKDYLSEAQTLRPFYTHLARMQGIKNAIAARKLFNTNRNLLVEALEKQYAGTVTTSAVRNNIALLKNNNTYTITTAHQPAIFTGTLYFVYKILHAIKLAEVCKKEMPENDFVPVFYMGSEDADLDELNKIFLHSEKIVWDTNQTGAVGRMHPKGLDKIISRIEGEIAVLPFGKELVQILKDCYLKAPDIQTATFHLINTLFGKYGLLVLIPDNALLKAVMQPIFEEDLLKQTASNIVEKTIQNLSKYYKVQANPRAINLFYLKGDKRDRIEWNGKHYEVLNTTIVFSKEEILKELHDHPERFSPNVILRGVFQETVLPNIAFIGGGGEMAYWLELKDMFNYFRVPYPVLVLRNSFLLVEKKWQSKINNLGFTSTDFFKTAQELLTRLAMRNKNGELSLAAELEIVQQWYDKLKLKAGQIDSTLEKHIEALQARASKPIRELEKKMLRAEKRKYADQSRQIEAIRAALFPFNSLQERIENFIPFYAKWGSTFIDMVYTHSHGLEQEFVLLETEA
jgi:bacillithiol biosynthesis cysteine-adding enzyme BshC